MVHALLKCLYYRLMVVLLGYFSDERYGALQVYLFSGPLFFFFVLSC